MEPPQHTSTTCHDSNPRYIITIWMTDPSFGEDVWRKKKKMMFETRSLDEFYINFVQLDYTRLKLFSSYLRFFARIWFRSCKICDAVDLEKQTNAGAIRRLENKTWGFFWIRWCCRHFLPFQLCHNNMTTISKQCKARVMSSNDNGQQCSISYKQVLLGLLCYFFILTTSRF